MIRLAVESTEDGVLIQQGIVIRRIEDLDDEDTLRVQRSLDKEVGYYLMNWLRVQGYPDVHISTKSVGATADNPSVRVEVTVKKCSD